MHLAELQLSLCSSSLGEGGIATDVAKSLARDSHVVQQLVLERRCQLKRELPLDLEFLEDLPV